MFRFRLSRKSMLKHASEPGLWYNGGRLTVHCWLPLGTKGPVCDGSRKGLALLSRFRGSDAEGKI